MKNLEVRIKFLLVLFLLSITSNNVIAQEFNVRSFQKMEMDSTARIKERLDLNDNPCAVVRVRVSKAEKFVFEGNLIGVPVYLDGEALVYMTSGSRSITIKSQEYGSMQYTFPEKLKKHVTYQLDLGLIHKGEYQTRTLLMPILSYGQGDILPFGIMIGIVKKFGGYIKGKTNVVDTELRRDFKYECDANGKLENGTVLLNKETETFRLAVTGGVLYRATLPLYLYGGLGYGFKDVYRCLDYDYNQYARNKDDSAEGVEFEVGTIYRMSSIAFSAGVQTCAFKHWEFSVGLGLMF